MYTYGFMDCIRSGDMTVFFFAFVFIGSDNCVCICVILDFRDLYEYDRNVLYGIWKPNECYSKSIQCLPIQTSRFRQPRKKFNIDWLIVWFGFVIRSSYFSTNSSKTTKQCFQNWYFHNAMQFHWVRNLFRSHLWISQVKCQLCMWHIIIIFIYIVCAASNNFILKIAQQNWYMCKCVCSK